MNKLIARFAALFCMMFVAPTTYADKLQDEAPVVAQQWLALVDAAKHAESWDELAPGFKKHVSKRKWRSTITELRNPLGKLDSRKLKSAEYSKELPGAPEGEYVVVKFDVAFAKKPAAVETVTTILGQDLIWRVSGYSVK